MNPYSAILECKFDLRKWIKIESSDHSINCQTFEIEYICKILRKFKCLGQRKGYILFTLRHAMIQKYAKRGFRENSKYAKSVFSKILNTLTE